MREPIFVAQVPLDSHGNTAPAKWCEADKNLPHWNWCAMCCVRMILLGLGMEAPDLTSLYTTAFNRYAVYRWVGGNVVGAYHRELATFIKSEFGLQARALRGLSIADVTRWIDSGHYVIASVSAEIREQSQADPERKNGHFVLIYATRQTDAGAVFMIYNSAGRAREQTQARVPVTEQRFAQCFSGNAIIVASDRP